MTSKRLKKKRCSESVWRVSHTVQLQIFAFFTKQFHSTVKGKDLILVLSLFVILLQYYKLWHKNLFHIRLKPLLFLISSQFWSQLMAILERPLAAKVKDLNFKWHHRKEGLLISEYSFSSLWHQCIHQVVSVLCNMDSVLQFPNNTVDVASLIEISCEYNRL